MMYIITSLPSEVFWGGIGTFGLKNRIIKDLNIKIAVITFILIPTICCNTAFGWASTDGAIIPTGQMFNEHKKILQDAYSKLQNDPAYSPEVFPELAKIKDWDWVRLPSREGPGPDGKGIKYSNHWYNPRTGMGNAPNAASEWYAELKRNLLGIGSSNAPKSAAYLAHYVADMSVPYHTTGIPYKEAMELYQDYIKLDEICIKSPNSSSPEIYETFTKFKGSWPSYLILEAEQHHLPLTPEDTASPIQKPQYIIILKPKVKLGSEIVGPNSEEISTWEVALSRWKEDNSTDNDWFDPWFYNGLYIPAFGYASTHILWETSTHQKPSGILTRYSKDFNQQQGNGNEENIKSFTKKVAEYTNQQSWWPIWTNTADIFDQAITNVYTVWRASFSALRPEYSVQASSDQGTLNITVNISNKEDSEIAKDVQVQVRTEHGNLKLIGPVIYELGDISPSDTVTIKDIWCLKSDGSSVVSDVLIIDVFGRYEDTPDSGTATFKKYIEVSKVNTTNIWSEIFPECDFNCAKDLDLSNLKPKTERYELNMSIAQPWEKPCIYYYEYYLDSQYRKQGPYLAYVEIEGKKIIRECGCYLDGERHGIWTEYGVCHTGCDTWYPYDGIKDMTTTFDHGKQTGLHINWWTNGNKQREVQMIDGKPIGYETEWNEDGSLCKVVDLSTYKLIEGSWNCGS